MEESRFCRPSEGTPLAADQRDRTSSASLTGASAQGGAAGEGGGRKEEGEFGQSKPGKAPVSASPSPRAAFPRADRVLTRGSRGRSCSWNGHPRLQRGRARDAGRGCGTSEEWGGRGPERGVNEDRAEARGGAQPEGTRGRPETYRTHRAAPEAARSRCQHRRPRTRARGETARGPPPRPPQARCRGHERGVPTRPPRCILGRPRALSLQLSLVAAAPRPATRRLWPRRRKWRLGVPPPGSRPAPQCRARRDVTRPHGPRWAEGRGPGASGRGVGPWCQRVAQLRSPLARVGLGPRTGAPPLPPGPSTSGSHRLEIMSAVCQVPGSLSTRPL